MSERIIEAEYENYRDDAPAASKNNNAESSPCFGCEYEKTDRSECVQQCPRLEAFQFNRPYKHLLCYQKPSKSPQIANASQEPLKSVKPITPKTTPWKRAMPVKQKKKPVLELTYKEKMKIIRETDKCLNCGRPKSKYTLRQGLCVSRCSGAWRESRIMHPLLGVWKRMSQEEVHDARWGRYDGCLMPDCTEVGDRRGLCQTHYRAWIGGSIEHPVLKKWFPKGRKKKKEVKQVEDQAKYETIKKDEKDALVTLGMMDEAIDEVLDETISKKKMDIFCEEGIKEIGHKAIQPKLIVNSILLDFLSYPEIYAVIKRQSEVTKLPAYHVIMNFLSYAIGAANEEAERRKK